MNSPDGNYYYLAGIIIGFGIYIYFSLIVSKIARDLGRQDAWRGWIYGANTAWYLCELAGFPIYYFLIMAIPYSGLAIWVYVWYRIAKRKGISGNILGVMIITYTCALLAQPPILSRLNTGLAGLLILGSIVAWLIPAYIAIVKVRNTQQHQEPIPEAVMP